MKQPGTLAERVDYRRLAIQRQTLAGRIALRDLPRVAAEASGNDQRSVAVELRFFEDAQRRVYVEGEIDAELALVCQRCLEPFDQPLTAHVFAVVVADDAAAANVPRADEPVQADGDQLDVHALVGDELLLAMPAVARCQRPQCRARYEQTPEVAGEKSNNARNPFAVLKTIKRDP